jgi:hypothetical protein
LGASMTGSEIKKPSRSREGFDPNELL